MGAEKKTLFPKEVSDEETDICNYREVVDPY